MSVRKRDDASMQVPVLHLRFGHLVQWAEQQMDVCTVIQELVLPS